MLLSSLFCAIALWLLLVTAIVLRCFVVGGAACDFMRYASEEILETFRMFHVESLDIRSVTLGINILDCVDKDAKRTGEKIVGKIEKVASNFVETVDGVSDELGVPITNKRIAVSPISLLLQKFPSVGNGLILAKSLDDAASSVGVDYIGGFSALVEKGANVGDLALMNSIPQSLAETKKVCSSVNVASTRAGINVDAVNVMARIIKETARATRKENSVGCAKIVVFCNAPSDNPFMAGAFHGVEEGDACINIGISGPSVIRSAIENFEGNLNELSDLIKRTAFKLTRVGELVGRKVSKRMGAEFGVVDLSLAPTTNKGDSIAEVIESMGIEKCGCPGTTAALALLTDAIKKGGVTACTRVGGLSGAFIPVSEDSGMNKRVAEKSISLEKLEALTSVCSVGLDMICLPGDTPTETIAGIILDEMAIGIVNDKTTACRLIPVFGKKAGESVDFGGLLGKGTIVNISKWTPSKFVKRGGQISRTVRSFKN